MPDFVNPVAASVQTTDDKLNTMNSAKAAAKNTVVLFGDSMTQDNLGVVGRTVSYQDVGMANWALSLSGWRLRVLYNAGISGQRTDQILARVQKDVISYSPGWVIELSGINDIGNDVAFSTIIANKQAIYDSLRAAGIRVIACTILPYGQGYPSQTTARSAVIRRVNQWMADYAAANSGIYIADTHSVIVDALSTIGVAKFPGALRDNLHPAPLGARAAGTVIANVIKKYVEDSGYHVSSYFDSAANDASIPQINGNPTFLQGAGGTAGTGVTGTVASSYTVQRGSGTPSAVASLVSRTDGAGNSQRMAITSGATGDILQMISTSVPARVANGDKLVAEGFIDVTGATNLRGITVTLFLTIDGLNYSNQSLSATNSTPDNVDNSDFSVVYRTPEFVVPAGSITQCYITVNATFNGVGGATVDIGRLSIRRITAGY